MCRSVVVPFFSRDEGSPAVQQRGDEKSRNFESMLLQAIVARTQARVGAALAVDKSTISRMVAGERALTLREFTRILAALDLALVTATDGETVTLSADEWRAYRTLARLALDNPDPNPGHNPGVNPGVMPTVRAWG